MDLGLTDRVFVVTAASGGLGRATAAQLVAEGAKVVLVARRRHVLDEAVAALGRDSAVSLPADLADPATAEAATHLALHAFGRLDGALISVGGPPAGSVANTTEEQWLNAFSSVFLAGLRVCRAVQKHSTAADLAIAWVLSTSVKSPIPGLAASNGLRPGLAMLVKQLADECGPDGTRVLAPAASRAAAEAAIPLRRYGQPEEFARVAAFALSPAASYLTGCVLPVDGGALRSL